MKTKYIFIIGFLIISLLVAIFVYLLFFGTPKSVQDIFANLGTAGDNDTGIVLPPVIEPEPTPTPTRPRLRQLTQRPVAGFIETNHNGSTHIQYVEMGSGNIYRINLLAGPEERISLTTVNETSWANFSNDGAQVVIRGRNTQRNSPITLGKIMSSGELETKELPDPVEEIKFISTSTLVFTTRNSGVGLTAKSFDSETSSTTTLFNIPFYESRVIWGTSTNSLHHVYVKPTTLFEGYLYSFSNNRMRRTPIGGFGLTVVPPLNNLIAYSHVERSTYNGKIRNLANGDVKELPIVPFPEKCTSGIIENEPYLWCGFQGDRSWSNTNLPDSWYRGQIVFQDEIYQINLGDLTTTLLVDTFAESGRQIDIWSMTIGDSMRALYFINRIDNTLWMYEL